MYGGGSVQKIIGKQLKTEGLKRMVDLKISGFDGFR